MTTSNIIVGALGAIIGAIVALIGNLVVLPYVLRRQQAMFEYPRTDGYQRTLVGGLQKLGLDQEKLASRTRLIYRLQMPILFAVAGAIFAVTLFGSD